MNEKMNPFAVLGLPRGANLKAIKKLYQNESTIHQTARQNGASPVIKSDITKKEFIQKATDAENLPFEDWPESDQEILNKIEDNSRLYEVLFDYACKNPESFIAKHALMLDIIRFNVHYNGPLESTGLNNFDLEKLKFTKDGKKFLTSFNTLVPWISYNSCKKSNEAEEKSSLGMNI